MPEGPWEIYHYYEDGSAVPDRFKVTLKGDAKPFVWDEAVAVRDTLNRLHAQEGKTDE